MNAVDQLCGEQTSRWHIQLYRPLRADSLSALDEAVCLRSCSDGRTLDFALRIRARQRMCRRGTRRCRQS